MKKIKGKVKEGYICVVKNEKRHHFASENYLMLYVEDATGNEFPLLFTENERNDAKKRAERRNDLIPQGSIFSFAAKRGHLTIVQNSNKKNNFEADFYHVVKITDENGKKYALLFTDYQFDIIYDRTVCNKEDIIKKNFFVDLFD